jgi:uncharacterized protein (TIGR02594 family)
MAAIPKQLEWLNKVGPLPVLVATALNFLGLAEFPTKLKNNPVIMMMAETLGLSKIYKNDETSWCALFVFYILYLCKKPFPPVGKDIYNYLRAKTFLGYGFAVPNDDLRTGDVVVYDRPGGFHVGFFIAFTKIKGKVYHIVLGGNQSNKVNFMEIDEGRLVQARRFYATAAPKSAAKYEVNSIGLISENEA